MEHSTICQYLTKHLIKKKNKQLTLVFIQELAVMFIISQVKAQDFASLSMCVIYRETKAGHGDFITN